MKIEDLMGGVALEAGTDYLYNKITKKVDYGKHTETIYRLYLKMGIGHKLELTNFFFISNSIELTLSIYDSQINDLIKGRENEEIERKNFYRLGRTSRILSNFRVKFLEFRFAF